MTRQLFALVALAVVALAGCGAPPVPRLNEPPEPIPMQAPAPPMPTALRIPHLGVSAPVGAAGLRPDGGLEIPDTAAEVSWFAGSPEPGELGPAVLLGHVDYAGKRGVFSALHTLAPGDEVFVDRRDTSPVRFVVISVERFEKEKFPTQRVYGDVPAAELRLITCGGVFDRGRPTESSPHGSYRDNWVVFARRADAPPGPPERP